MADSEPDAESGVHVIAADGGSDRAFCQCGTTPTNRCRYRLTGRHAGQQCGKPLCDRCVMEIGSEFKWPCCIAHAQLIAKGHNGE